jgi:hypothetical protein
MAGGSFSASLFLRLAQCRALPSRKSKLLLLWGNSVSDFLQPWDEKF